MKQFIAMLMLLLVVGMSIPAAMAAEKETGNVTAQAKANANAKVNDNETEVDAESAAEIGAMDTRSGAEMRLLQLKHQIEVKSAQASRVIDDLKVKANLTANQTADLEAYVTQLNALSTKVDAAVTQLNNQTNQDAVESFLAIKSEAKTIVGDFRDKVHTYANAAEQEKIRTDIAKVKAKDEAKLQARIKDLREEHNAAHAKQLFVALGVNSTDEFVAQIKSGNITADDIRAAMKERLNNLSTEQRTKVAENLREEYTKQKVARAAFIEEHKADITQKREEILREQLGRINNTTAKARLQQRLNILEQGGNLSGMGVRSETRTETRVRDGATETKVRDRVRADDTESDENESGDDVTAETDDGVNVEVKA